MQFRVRRAYTCSASRLRPNPPIRQLLRNSPWWWKTLYRFPRCFSPAPSRDQAYNAQLQGSGGTGNFIWSILTGALPTGISLTDPVNGVLAGTAPGANGVFPITVQLLDQVTQEKVTQVLSITVVNGVAILTPSLPNATLNQPYQFNLIGNGANLVWSVGLGSQLPPGFSLSPGGLLSGTGSEPGRI